MRWGFIVNVTGCSGSQITEKVRQRAEEAILSSGMPKEGRKKITHRASITSYQSRDDSNPSLKLHGRIEEI